MLHALQGAWSRELLAARADHAGSRERALVGVLGWMGKGQLMKMIRALTDKPRVPQTFPEPVEIADYVPTEADMQALAKAEEKRLRKQQKREQHKTQASS